MKSNAPARRGRGSQGELHRGAIHKRRPYQDSSSGVKSGAACGMTSVRSDVAEIGGQLNLSTSRKQLWHKDFHVPLTFGQA
jgi:hypothetical protein